MMVLGVLCGQWWSMMAQDGPRWLRIVHDGLWVSSVSVYKVSMRYHDSLWWTLMVYDGLWWFLRGSMMAYDSPWWFPDGCWWSLMYPDGLWVSLNFLDFSWWSLVFSDGTWWSMMVHDGPLCSMMAPEGLWWFTITPDGLQWSISSCKKLWGSMSVSGVYDGLWWSLMVFHKYLTIRCGDICKIILIRLTV